MQTDSSTTFHISENYISGIAPKIQIVADVWDKKIKSFLEENNKLAFSIMPEIPIYSTAIGKHFLGWVDKAEILTKKQLIEILKANLSGK